MAALTAGKNTPFVGDKFVKFGKQPVAASTVIYTGALVAFNASGYLTPGAVSAALVAGGVARDYADNSSGADGDVEIEVWGGLFWVGNGTGGDEITLAHVGSPCYYLDDQTVSNNDGTGTRSAAGTILDVNATDGVLIKVRS